MQVPYIEEKYLKDRFGSHLAAETGTFSMGHETMVQQQVFPLTNSGVQRRKSPRKFWKLAGA